MLNVLESTRPVETADLPHERPVDGSAAGTVIETQTPIIVGDASQPGPHADLRERLRANGMRAECCCR